MVSHQTKGSSNSATISAKGNRPSKKSIKRMVEKIHVLTERKGRHRRTATFVLIRKSTAPNHCRRQSGILDNFNFAEA